MWFGLIRLIDGRVELRYVCLGYVCCCVSEHMHELLSWDLPAGIGRIELYIVCCGYLLGDDRHDIWLHELRSRILSDVSGRS